MKMTLRKDLSFAIALLILSICSIHTLNAQRLPAHLLQVAGGYSKHGSGDMKGIVYGVEYSKYSSNKFSLNYQLRSSINNSKHTIIVNNVTSGTQSDASIRFTTAGVQLGVNARSSLIRNNRHEFLVSLGAFGRYQSASNGSDGYALHYPNTTGVPTVLVEYFNSTPQKTYALGGLLQVQYNFSSKNNYSFGIAPGFQTDTNGDALPQVALVIGKRFN